MKISNILFGLVALALITGCKDDDKNTQEFSDLSVEQHKANIEQSGLNVINQLDDLGNMDAIKVLIDFVELADTTYETGTMAVLKPVLSLQDGADAALTLKAAMIEEESLAQSFIDEAGIYTYNSVTDSWDKETATDEITYIFPTHDSETNNASISVTNFDSFTTDNPDVAQVFDDELLRSVTVTLTVNDQQMMAFDFEAEYDEDDVPLSVSQSYFIGKYEIATTASRSTSKVSFEQSFTYDDANIVTFHFDSDGTIDYNTVRDGYNGEGDFVFNQTILDASNMWIVVDNLKIQGVANWKGLRNAGKQVENIESDQEYWELAADAFNDNTDLYLKYNDSNEIIAASEFYAYLYNDEYSSYWTMSMRMLFSDGSSMDGSFFSEENFANLIREAENLVNRMETNYGITSE